MKKLLCSLCVTCLAGAAIAQNATSDTVRTGSGYVNQVWYSLETGQKTAIPATSWDIAFKTGMSATILINDGADVALWKYPNGDTSAWNAIDTIGISGWTALYNAPADWETGAFNAPASGSQLDYGWGSYDMSVHTVTGNVLFVIKLSNGDYKKLFIQELTTDGTYHFKYADLDGSNEVQATLAKDDFVGKNFAYYSLTSGQSLNPEPDSDNWDLLFTQYTDLIPAGIDTLPYKVTGILSNLNVKVAIATPVDADQYTDYASQNFDSSKNAIGYDWKSYDMNQSAYTVVDSTVYFVSSQLGDIWKVVFSGFGGSTDGAHIFTKTKLYTSAISGPSGRLASFALYPNPATQGRVTISCNVNEPSTPIHLIITDVRGRIQYETKWTVHRGMNLHHLTTGSWSKGIYFLTMEVAGETTTRKLIVR